MMDLAERDAALADLVRLLNWGDLRD